MQNDSEADRISNILKDKHICTRCLLRYRGLRDCDIYCLNNDEIIDKYKSFVNENGAKTSERGCFSCFGILDDAIAREYVEKIIKTIEDSKFEFYDFLGQLSLCASFAIHQKLIELFLESQGFTDLRPTPMKQAWKWHCGPILEERLGKLYSMDSKFNIHIQTETDPANEECVRLMALFDTSKKKKRIRRSSFTQSEVNGALNRVSLEKLVEICGEWRPLVATDVVITLMHEPIFVGGRYTKLSRTLPQTPWLVDGDRRCVSSVEELISVPIREWLRCTATTFSASGREDVDVRTLGRGRPFLIECLNPQLVTSVWKNTHHIEEMINSRTSDIQVLDLTVIPKDKTDSIKIGEEDKTKTYRALCFCQDGIDEKELTRLCQMGAIDIVQKTPVRVLHRRPLLDRKRTIFSMKYQLIDERHCYLELMTQAGTYIKEFVHGDLGRTLPNLRGLLGKEMDILALDVLEVDVEWPPVGCLLTETA